MARRRGRLDVTISATESPLVREPLSQENHSPMNRIHNAVKPIESNLAPSQNLSQGISSDVRVEPCEFERLLQRAMEILSTRARTATASSS